MKRTESARTLAKFCIAIVILVAIIAIYNWESTKAFIAAYDAQFKLIGLGVGPFLAFLGFVWGLLDKAELKDLAEELGSAREQADAATKAAVGARAEVEKKIAKIDALESDLATIADSRRLWKLRQNMPFSEYRGWKFDPIGAKVVTVGLFKGGVGKTHLAANFAAYVSEKQQKRVLIIDLDYQGSLSTIILPTAGHEPVGSNVDALFEAHADLATLSAKRIQLAPQGDNVSLNGGKGLSRAWVVPADYTLSDTESRLLIERVMNESDALDERYRLAHVLLHPAVRQEYAMIILDTPPRMTLGTVNAFVASHFVVMPAIFDRVSSEAVRPFLEQVQSLSNDLELELKLAGIVGTLTGELLLSDTEKVYRNQIIATAAEVLGVGQEIMVEQNLPRKNAVLNGADLGYFLKDSVGPLRERFYDAIFDELWTRIIGPKESR